MSLTRREWTWFPWFGRDPEKRLARVLSARLSGIDTFIREVPTYTTRSPDTACVSSTLVKYLALVNRECLTLKIKNPTSLFSCDSEILAHHEIDKSLYGEQGKQQVATSDRQIERVVYLGQGHSEQDEMRLQIDTLKHMVLDLKSTVDCFYCPCNNVEKAYKLLPRATRLRMLSVVKNCDLVLRRGLSVRNCISTFKLAKKLEGLDQLQKEAEQFIFLNFSQVWKDCPDIKDLSLEELQTWLLSNELTVDEEENIFKAVERWIVSHQQSRREHIQTLVDAVRLPCCTKEFLLDLLVHPLTADCPAVVNRVRTLLHVSEQDPERVMKKGQELRRPRPPDKQVIYALGGRTSSLHDEAAFETLDPQTKTWTCRNDVPDPPRGEAVALPIGNKIMVVEMDSERVRLFDPLTLTWESRTPLPISLRGVSIVVMGKHVHIIGGYFRRRATNRCFVYDYLADTYESQPSLIHSRTRCSSTTLKGKIYCSGGRNENHRTMNSMESIDLKQEIWVEEAPMIHTRWGHALVACSNYLWAFGGCRTTLSLCEVERYDPDTAQWIGVSCMPTARRSLSVIMFENHFYAIGGIDRGKPLTVTEVYDPENNTWKERSGMCKARAALGACVFKNGKECTRTCHAVVCKAVERIREDTYIETLPATPRNVNYWCFQRRRTRSD